MTVNEDIVDGITRHRVYLLRYEAGAVRRAVDAYSDALGDVEAELRTLERAAAAGESFNAGRQLRLIALRADIDAALRRAQEAVQEQVANDLEGAALAEARIVGRHVGGALPSELRLSFTTVPEDMVMRLLQQEMPRWTDSLQVGLFTGRQAIQRQLAAAAAQGLSVDQQVRALRNTLGLVDRQRNDIRRLVRTEMQRAANDVALETYARNRDVVKAVQYLATLDNRVCPLCGPQHNKVYTLTPSGSLPSDAPRIPRHPNCRCFYAPVTKSWAELGIGPPPGQEGRLTGEPDNIIDFDHWLRRQPEEQQRDVLETAWRYEAWKSGTSMESFSTGDDVLTREEFEARSAA